MDSASARLIQVPWIHQDGPPIPASYSDLTKSINYAANYGKTRVVVFHPQNVKEHWEEFQQFINLLPSIRSEGKIELLSISQLAKSISYSLSVNSDYGSPSPSVGIHSYISGDQVTASVYSPITEGNTIWTCTGWIGTGSVPSSGSGTRVSFTITQDSSITWIWEVIPEKVATPIITPSSGTYEGAQTVSISCTTVGSTIRYTTDGSQPTSSSTIYTDPLIVNRSMTIITKAFKTGMIDSDPASARYTILLQKVSTPIISLATGTYKGTQIVEIFCTTSGATIRYTTNGFPPTSSSPIYNNPITVSSSLTIMAKAFLTDWIDSDVASATYTIRTKADTPIITPFTGTYSAPLIVSITSSDGIQATIRYTDDGSTPTSSSPVYIDPFILDSSMTIKARAYVHGLDPSDVATSIITVASPSNKVPTPVINPPTGSYSSPQTVSIDCDLSPVTIRYTTDGSQPTSTSKLYTGPFEVSSTTTVKAKAFRTGWTDSDEVYATITIGVPSIGSIASKHAKDGETYTIANVNVGNTPLSVILYYPSHISNPKISDFTGSIIVKDSTLTPLVASNDLTTSFIVNSSITLALAKMRSWSAPDPSIWTQMSDAAGGCYIFLIITYGGIQSLWTIKDILVAIPTGGLTLVDVVTRAAEISSFAVQQMDTLVILNGSTAAFQKSLDTLSFTGNDVEALEAMQTIYESYKVNNVISINEAVKWADFLAYLRTFGFVIEVTVDMTFTNEIGDMVTTWCIVGTYSAMNALLAENMVFCVNSMNAGSVTATQIYSMLEFKMLYVEYKLAICQSLVNMYQSIVDKGPLSTVWYLLLDAPNSLQHYRDLYDTWTVEKAGILRQRTDFYSALDRCYQQSITRTISMRTSFMPIIDSISIGVFAVAVVIFFTSPRMLVTRVKKVIERRRRKQN